MRGFRHPVLASAAVSLALCGLPHQAEADEPAVRDETPVSADGSGSDAGLAPLRDWWARSPWRFNGLVYGWLPEAPARISADGVTTKVPEKFDTILDDLDMFAVGMFEVHKGPIGVFAAPLYFAGKDNESFKGPLGEKRRVRLKETVWVVDYGASFVLGPWDLGKQISVAVEPYAGFRYLNDRISLKLDRDALGPGFTFRHRVRFNTPIVGVRTLWDITDRWTLHLAGDRGGWDTDHVNKTSQLYGTLGYRFKMAGISSHAFAGWRYVQIHYRKKVDLKLWIRGPVFGIGVEF